LEGNQLATPNAWEAVKRQGEPAIHKWIADQMAGRSCAVVLVGQDTANRKWVRYEILKAWNDRLGVVGIRVHKLLDQDSRPSTAGENPFYKTGDNKLAGLIPIKDPAGHDSKAVYATIANSIESWIEEAIKIRSGR
jgi:hypothetical protein